MAGAQGESHFWHGQEGWLWKYDVKIWIESLESWRPEEKGCFGDGVAAVNLSWAVMD